VLEIVVLKVRTLCVTLIFIMLAKIGQLSSISGGSSKGCIIISLASGKNVIGYI